MKRSFVVFLLIIASIGASIFFYFKNIGVENGQGQKPAGEYAHYKVTDIQKDGKVDDSDKFLIQRNFGCTKGSTCWSRLVGKTTNGDNPIYSSDLDLNKDGIIDQSDVDSVK